MSRQGVAEITVSSVGDSSLPALVLLHGWGFGSVVWQPLLDDLQQTFCVHVIDLPGYGASSDAQNSVWEPESLLAAFAEKVAQPALWCGWSLGGMLAAQYAFRYPQRVTALLTLCSNPRFVANNSWPTAMVESTFDQFVEAVAAEPQAAIERFAGLVTQGGASMRADLRQLKQLAIDEGLPATATLSDSLTLLGGLDIRGVITNLEVPQRHIFSEKDALVPVEAATATAALNENAQVEVLPQASHIPWLSQTKELSDSIRSFAAGLK